jgi:hypothetical protein
MISTLLLAGCSSPGDANKTYPPSGASIAIETTDGVVKLGLENDTVFMGLTDSVLTDARTNMARDTEETGGIASKIERFVKGEVSSALGTKLKYPLADIDSAVYSDGAIRFAYRNKRKMSFENVTIKNRKALSSFSPDDAQRFVSTLNSAIHKVRGVSN